MKQLICSICIILLFPVGIIAQESEQTDKNAQKIDSLQQMVNMLSSKVQTQEEDKRNEEIWKNRKKYFNIGYVNQTLTHEEIQGLEWKSDYGFSLSFGRTYYLHKKPLFKMLKFGLDLTIPDITYVKYSSPTFFQEEQTGNNEDEDIVDLGMHQIDLGIHIGPSITLNPIDHLKISTYFHFAPSASVVILDDEVNTQYVSFLTFGGAIAYKAISLGIEGRWGSANYKSLSVSDEKDYTEEEYEDVDNIFSSDKNKLKTKSVRFYLSFRF